METPFKISEVEGKLRDDMNKDFMGFRDGFVQVGPEKYILPKKYQEDVDKLRSFKPRSSDVWTVTFPRSGTTWTQELVWLLSNELNFEKARSIPLYDRFPFLEFSTFFCDGLKQQLLDEANGNQDLQNSIEESAVPAFVTLNKEESQRFIKTHLPFSLLSPDLLQVGAKIIYIARNPKDVAVSNFHLYKLFRTLDFKSDFRRFWDYFEGNHIAWAPYWSHIKEGWQMRHCPNVCFMFYEDINRDLRGTILKLSNFFNKEVSSDDMKLLQEHLHLSNFRLNPSVNFEPLRSLGYLNDNSQGFIRQGKINGSQEYYDGDLNARAQKWIDSNMKQIDGFQFPIKLSQTG